MYGSYNFLHNPVKAFDEWICLFCHSGSGGICHTVVPMSGSSNMPNRSLVPRDDKEQVPLRHDGSKKYQDIEPSRVEGIF